MEEHSILFRISVEQAKKIAKYCYQDYNKLSSIDICNLLASIINNLGGTDKCLF